MAVTMQMAVTIKETEAAPTSYPALPADIVASLSFADGDRITDTIWQRIESYCRLRWTARQVVWIVEGPGWWDVPLSPVTVNSVGIWDGGVWVDCPPDGHFLGGYEFYAPGPYRIEADVGGGTVPAAVFEAYRRLGAYSSETADKAGASARSIDIGGAIKESYERNPAWMARAMVNSGAGDLLRPYRRRA